MRIGFIENYNDTCVRIVSYHPDYNSIPDDQKAKMPEWRALPDDYEHLPGINLMNIETGEITNIPPVVEPEPPRELTLDDLMARMARMQEDQVILMKSIIELGGMLP